ncbi:hypothetical protein [Gordonibacter sp. Marseille-P4307]|uniref:hypothetical protein n=1 Tax=Gordonibacter sp. Marseille-P4307 TaxID=2161815 RepID=UPI000F534D1F|nr:hypothetical protein [Gordonibacter sp. Marseille-P4307]
MFDKMGAVSHRVSSSIAVLLWAASALPFVWREGYLYAAVIQAVFMVVLSALNFKVGLPQRNEIVAFCLAWAALYLVWVAAQIRLALIVAQLVVAGMCLFVVFLSLPKRYRDRSRSSKAAFSAALLCCAAMQAGIVFLMILWLQSASPLEVQSIGRAIPPDML